MQKLRLYQVQAVKEILDKKKVLIADDMGLGKCAESIVAKTAIENRQGYNSRTLVVCPASVVQHWEDEIKLWYKKHDYTKIAKIQTPSYDSDIKDVDGADFVIVGYPTLSIFGKERDKVQKLRRLEFQYGIVDEVHNAKNPESIRSLTVKGLFDSMEYLALLSGTPVPNSVIDIYMLMSLLDKENFPINGLNTKYILMGFYELFKKDPEFVRRILNDRMIRRSAEEYLHSKIPELIQNTLEVRLDDEHKEVYTQIYENDDIRPQIKLIQLLKASIDPNLVNPNILNKKFQSRIGKMNSCVYSKLDDLIEQIVDNKGKVLIFSNLKEGVIDVGELKERYKEYGADIINGDTSSLKFNGKISKREQIRRKFQNDPDCKVLLATTVMDEGVDLTAATDIIHLTLPYTPAAFDQRNKRSQRPGEVSKDKVNVHVIKPVLDNLLPTITEGIERLLNDKRKIIDYLLYQPFSLTRKDLEEFNRKKIVKSKRISTLVNNPVKTIFSHWGQLKGSGFNNILTHYIRYPDEAEYIARLYASYWKGYYGGNTANLYTKVIKILEKKVDLERKLDIASGPFALSRKLGEPVINLDINSYMFDAGRILEEEGKIVKGNLAVQGMFHQLPFESNSFDLAVCSLALHMSKLKTLHKNKYVNERELAFREMNRILRLDGYSIVTLPYTTIRNTDLPNFYTGLETLGFEILPFSGFYSGPKDSKFKVYLAGLRKESEPCSEELDSKYLEWKMDKKTMIGNRHSVKKRKHALFEPKKTEQEIVNEFYHTIDRRSLEDLVRECIK